MITENAVYTEYGTFPPILGPGLIDIPDLLPKKVWLEKIVVEQGIYTLSGYAVSEKDLLAMLDRVESRGESFKIVDYSSGQLGANEKAQLEGEEKKAKHSFLLSVKFRFQN